MSYRVIQWSRATPAGCSLSVRGRVVVHTMGFAKPLDADDVPLFFPGRWPTRGVAR